MIDSPTVPITDARPTAVRIVASDLRGTDRVYDTTGGTHALSAVWRAGRNRATVAFRRVDSRTIHTMGPDETITVERDPRSVRPPVPPIPVADHERAMRLAADHDVARCAAEGDTIAQAEHDRRKARA